MDSLYYGEHQCHCGHTHFHDVDGSVRFDADVLAQFLRNIYKGFDTDHGIEATMWREVLRIINEGTVEGLAKAKTPPTHEQDFYEALRHSNEVFAAFKVHTMGVEMASKLHDADGKLKPFGKWVEDVGSISSHQVGSWLQTEYDTAVIRAHAAADWREFERNKDIMPNLRWMPTTSKEPESSHRAYWQMKLTLPVDDPFWEEHHPGDRWNCKCSLEATDDPVVRPAGMEPTKPQRGLENNPGKDGHTFSDNHPYFPKGCSSCPFNKGFKNKMGTFFKNENKHCYDCAKIDNAIQQMPDLTAAKSLIDNVANDMIARKTACKIYSFDENEVRKLKAHGIELESKELYLPDQRVLHALRDFKQGLGKSVSSDEFKNFVDNIGSCSMYIDTEKSNIIFSTKHGEKVLKFVFEPNYKIKANGKKFVANSFITAGITKEHNLNERKYIKIR